MPSWPSGSKVGIRIFSGGSRPSSTTARAANVPLRVETGDPTERIVAEMSSDAVLAGVLGARRMSGGPRPVGSTALEVITPPSDFVPDAVRPGARGDVVGSLS